MQKLGVYTKEQGFISGITATAPKIKREGLTVVSAASYRAGKVKAIAQGKRLRRQLLESGGLVG